MRNEGRRDWLSQRLLLPLYGAISSRGIRKRLRTMAMRREGGAMYTLTVREMLSRYHGVDVGLYTIGPCESGAEGLASGTVIGRYCSIYYTVRTNCDEELANCSDSERLFFASCLGSMGNGERSNAAALRIGNDVFIGHSAAILSTVGEIGDGAFIGAGAVVHKPVPPYAVVMGNPARVVRYRFSEQTIASLLQSQWWTKSLDELAPKIDLFKMPVEGSLRFNGTEIVKE